MMTGSEKLKKLSFLGLGAMGQRMAGNLVAAGYQVTVWNRDPGRVPPLTEQGAQPASTPKDAVRDADIVLSMVRDDAASQTVWLDRQHGAVPAMKPGAIAVECSTVSPAHVRSLAASCKRTGIGLVDAPVAGSRPQAAAGQLVFLTGGAEHHVSAIAGVLAVLGSRVVHAGPVGSGAAAKLLVNGMFGAQLVMMAELLTLLSGQGHDAGALLRALAATPVCSPAARAGAEAMIAGQWQPSFPIDLVVKDFDLIRRLSRDPAQDAPLTDAAFQLFADAVARGYGADNITGIVQRYQAP